MPNYAVLSDINLATLITEVNDPDSALTLFNRYETIVRRISYLDPEDRGGVYDTDDARQDCFLAIYEAAASLLEKPQFGFARHFRFAASNKVRESKAQARGSAIVPLTQYKWVVNAVKEQGNPVAAREWLATEAPPGRGMTRETFDSVWFWLFGQHVEWSDPTPAGRQGQSDGLSISDVTADESATRSFRAIEDREAVTQLLSTLPESWQQVMVRLYGLKGHPEHSTKGVAAALGLYASAVSRIHSKALARLMANSDLPSHYIPREETGPGPRSTVGGNRQETPEYAFPVTVSAIA